jgi:hypothetical protein
VILAFLPLIFPAIAVFGLLYGTSDAFRVWLETTIFRKSKISLIDFDGEVHITYAEQIENRQYGYRYPCYKALRRVRLMEDGTTDNSICTEWKPITKRRVRLLTFLR